MKLISIFLFIMVGTSFAKSECPKKFDGVSIKGLFDAGYSDEPIEEFAYQLESKSYAGLSEEEFNNIPVLSNEFQYLNCKNAIISISFFDLETKESFQGYYTFEDSCDGGNSHGSIFNEENEYIANIRDGEFFCLEK